MKVNNNKKGRVIVNGLQEISYHYCMKNNIKDKEVQSAVITAVRDACTRGYCGEEIMNMSLSALNNESSTSDKNILKVSDINKHEALRAKLILPDGRVIDDTCISYTLDELLEYTVSILKKEDEKMKGVIKKRFEGMYKFLMREKQLTVSDVLKLITRHKGKNYREVSLLSESLLSLYK